MKQLILFLFTLMLVPFTSCKDEVEEGEENLRQPSTSLYVVLLDKEGNDLLDPETEGAYDVEKIKTQVYWIIDGEKVLNANRSSISLVDRMLGDEMFYPYYQLCFMIADGEPDEEGKITVIIKWDETFSNTITCDVNTDYFKEIERVYVDDELAWGPGADSISEVPYICLVK